MKPAPFAYHAPAALDEAAALLADLGADAKVLAGGQSLMPMLNMRLAAPKALVDVTRVSGLDRVDVSGGAVRVGARVTHEQLLRSPAARTDLPLLGQALRLVAHPVIRHRGTTVGSIVHADPAAEMPAVLMLLGGDVEAVSATGSARIPAEEFFVGPMESVLEPEQVAVAVSFLRPPGTAGTSFVELARRHGDYALVGVGGLVTVVDAGRDAAIASARVVLIGVGDTPVVVDVTSTLSGVSLHDVTERTPAASDGAVVDAIDQVRARVEPHSDVHATADYRRHLAGVLTGRALQAAAIEAGERARAERRVP